MNSMSPVIPSAAPSDMEAADHAMRHWSGTEPGQIGIGSPQHLRLFTRMLLETHNPYKPAVMLWPHLEPDALARLTSLPIWDIAVQTEGKASIRVKTFAATVKEPLLKDALEMDGGEEARHKAVLSNLVARYGIALEPEPDYLPPTDAEWAWLVTGYSECIDSFFAFGLFALAKQSGYFPPELVETFEPVIQEEARHILFFANWLAWHRRNLSLPRRVTFEARILGVWAFLLWERIGIAKGIDAKGEARDANFAMTGGEAIGVDVSPRTLIALCLDENERRMAGYDQRLLRPSTVPFLSRIALRLLPRPKSEKPVEIGSQAHKTLFCRQFIDSYTEFTPETLPWPDLTAEELERLRRVPFWQEVRHTERRAGAIVKAFAETIDDPLLREAIELQGLEEARHARLLAVMIERYDIDAPEQPLKPIDGDLEKRFIDFGFGECLDSFLGFGAFKFARQSGFLPAPMFEIFDRLMFEETRHIVFFVNWMAWREAGLGRKAALLRHANSLRFYGRAIGRLVGTMKRGQDENDGKDFSATQASMFLDGFTFRRFVEECYSENGRRMSLFEPALLQPRFLPRLADAALSGLRLWDRLRPSAITRRDWPPSTHWPG
jgi:hypothetical protein